MQQIKILYAEDYDLVLYTVKQLLELEGWRVELCRDGATALKRIETREHYDLLILDADMPGMHGLELLKRARSMTHRRRTPVILFTATDCEAEARSAGADAFLKKPNGIRDLIQTVEQLLDGRNSQFDYRDQQSSSNRS
ncbi:MAG TPA: response regulator [Pyrinomonadaceae bacterium]